MTTTQAFDDLLTQPRPVAPFPLVRTAGPLPLDDARLLAALIEQRDDLEALLQDQPYWDGYAARSDGFAALDHRVSIRDQATELNRRIYQLQNPGAPTLKEQGHAYAAARKSEADAKKAKKSSPLNLLAGMAVLAAIQFGVLLALGGGMSLFVHVLETTLPPPAVEVYR